MWVIAHALDQVIYKENLKVRPSKVDYWAKPVTSYDNGTMIRNFMLEVSETAVTLCFRCHGAGKAIVGSESQAKLFYCFPGSTFRYIHTYIYEKRYQNLSIVGPSADRSECYNNSHFSCPGSRG